MSKKKIAVVIVDRANYGRLKPVLSHLKANPEVDLQVVCAGTMLLDRFGRAENIVKADGFEVIERVYMELEGSNPETMAKSIGLGIGEFSYVFNRMKPDLITVIGDRYEALGAVIAAAYLNMTIVHLQGGEVSGSIDESARHAMTKFSHYHFPATKRAAEYIVRMGEDPATVFNFGCPVADVIMENELTLPAEVFKYGVGAEIDPRKPYLMVVFHPITTDFGGYEEKVEELLNALSHLRMPTVWLWPNIDAGADRISKVLRQYRERESDTWLRLVKNFEPKTFQSVLFNSACAVGNSSSFVRDSTFTGTPVVLVGNRQFGREVAENTIMTPCSFDLILAAVQRQLKHGRYASSSLYGAEGASKRIADQLAKLEPRRGKYLNYIDKVDHADPGFGTRKL